ncbi:enoyl-CoA hydratase [Virgibacillus sp. W0181]|uniref:enoyl-CoA hydratase n=1 Tax=Virgibacillus sp. W0181 TaxID=3391581 RepID=UPI003F446905
MSELVNLQWAENHVAIMTINRPDAANAMSTDMLDQMNEHVHTISENTAARSLIVTGAGRKVFCAGADLKERKKMTDKQVLKTVRHIGRTITSIENLDIPVIAAINGAAFGGGLELALACDIRIAADHAKMGLTETALAIIPGAGGTQRLPRLIGSGQAKRLIYTAARIDAEEATKIGLIEQAVNHEELVDTAVNMAKIIATNGPIALKQAKLAINKGMQMDINTGIEFEHLCYKETLHTRDRIEGLKAFKEKRNPVYKGN